MRIILRPLASPEEEVDLTARLVSAIAEELWQLYGGNSEVNWLEAERHLQQLVGMARQEALDTAVAMQAGTASDGHSGPGQGPAEPAVIPDATQTRPVKRKARVAPPRIRRKRARAAPRTARAGRKEKSAS